MKEIGQITMALLVASLFITMLAPVDAYEPPEGICGYVYDQITGKPVGNAYVTGGGTSDYTSSNGAYALSIPQYGTFTISVTHNGHIQAQSDVSITRRVPMAQQDFQLGRARGYSGWVYDMNTNQPISGATFSVYELSPGKSTTTDAFGWYFVATILNTGYNIDLSAQKSGYQQHWVYDQDLPYRSYISTDFYLQPDCIAWVNVISAFCTYSNPNIGCKISIVSSVTETVTISSYAGGTGGSHTVTTSQQMSSPRYNVTGYGLERKVLVTGISTGESTYSVESAWIKQHYDETRWVEYSVDPLWASNVSGSIGNILGAQGNIPAYVTYSNTQCTTNQHSFGLDLSVGVGNHFGSTSFTLSVVRKASSSYSNQMSVEIINYGSTERSIECYRDQLNTYGSVLHIWVT